MATATALPDGAGAGEDNGPLRGGRAGGLPVPWAYIFFASREGHCDSCRSSSARGRRRSHPKQKHGTDAKSASTNSFRFKLVCCLHSGHVLSGMTASAFRMHVSQKICAQQLVSITFLFGKSKQIGHCHSASSLLASSADNSSFVAVAALNASPFAAELKLLRNLISFEGVSSSMSVVNEESVAFSSTSVPHSRVGVGVTD